MTALAPGPALIPGTTVVVPQMQEQGAVVTRQEFELLLEGAPANRDASRRDVCAGVAVTAVVGLVGIVLTAEYFRDKAPQVWAWVFTTLLVALILATGIVAWLAHQDSKRYAGSAYTYCVQRIRQRFGPVAAPAPTVAPAAVAAAPLTPPAVPVPEPPPATAADD